MNVFSYLQQIYAESAVPHLFSNHFKLLKGYVGSDETEIIEVVGIPTAEMQGLTILLVY